MKRLAAALAGALGLFALGCGGTPDVPEHLGIYLDRDGDLVRLEWRRSGDLAEAGGFAPAGRLRRADIIGYPSVEDETPTVYLRLGSASPLGLVFRHFAPGLESYSDLYPLISPVEDQEDVFRVDFPEGKGQGQCEILLPNDLICGFLIEPEK